MHKTDNQIKMGNKRRRILFLWPFVLAGLVFLSVQFAIRNSGFVERYYSMGIYPAIARVFSSISKLIPFSLWDVFWVFIILMIILGLVLVILKKIKFWFFGLRILQTLAFLYSFFYMVWGYNYFRPSIDKRLGWKGPKSDEEEFKLVLDSIIKETNYNYTTISSADYPKIDSLIEESYKKQRLELGIKYPNGSRRPKTMLFSSLYGKLGLSGYFGPFFNEVHVNHDLLPMDYPFVLAHEKAHQFGITSEAEANFVAFVICIKSDDRRLRYSGYQSLLQYFLGNASHLKNYHEYLNKIDKNVINDLKFRNKYYQGLENKNLSAMQSAVDNVYLKANKIDKGIRNYDQVVSLVLSWYNNSERHPVKN